MTLQPLFWNDYLELVWDGLCSGKQGCNAPPMLRLLFCGVLPHRRLYFQTLAVMGVVFLLAGLANTWTILRFRGDDYSGGQDEVNEQM